MEFLINVLIDPLFSIQSHTSTIKIFHDLLSMIIFEEFKILFCKLDMEFHLFLRTFLETLC